MNNLIFRFFCFYMSVVFLSGCRQDDETDINKMPEDMVAVNIPIGGISIGSDDPLSTRGSSSDTLTVTEKLDDGLVLETSLIPVSTASTRGITNYLNNNAQILAIVYKEDGSLYKYQYFTPDNPTIHLPKGESFCLVFYSYNNTTKPDISGSFTGTVVNNGKYGYHFSAGSVLGTKTEEHSNNVMWGKIASTGVITDGVKLAPVMFAHLFSQLTWIITSDLGVISNCSGEITNTYQSRTINLSKLKTDNNDNVLTNIGTATYSTPVVFSQSGASITSNATSFCPNEGQALTLRLINCNVGSMPLQDKTIQINKQLKRGVWYTARTKVTLGIEAASNNLYYQDGEYIFKRMDLRSFDVNAFFVPDIEKPSDGVAATTKVRTSGMSWQWDPCSKVTINGGGWRLPTVNELKYFFQRQNGWDLPYTGFYYNASSPSKPTSVTYAVATNFSMQTYWDKDAKEWKVVNYQGGIYGAYACNKDNDGYCVVLYNLIHEHIEGANLHPYYSTNFRFPIPNHASFAFTAGAASPRLEVVHKSHNHDSSVTAWKKVNYWTVNATNLAPVAVRCVRNIRK